MRILLTCLVVKDTDRVEVFFHYLHPDVKALAWCLPGASDAVRDTLDRIFVRRLRPLLHTLCVLRVLQRRFETASRREAAMLGGGRARSLKKVVDATVLHDASTLYMGVRNGDKCWVEAREPCARCGTNAWGVSCTPPRLTPRGTLVRDELDEMQCFCWSCMSRRAPADMWDHED